MLIVKNLLIFMSSSRYCCILCVLGFFGAKEHDSEEPECKRDKYCTWTASHIT
jgi:hypothetical protein